MFYQRFGNAAFFRVQNYEGNVLLFFCVVFLTNMSCQQLCSHCGWLLLKCSAIGIGFNEAETNCGIAHILGILLMNSYEIKICSEATII